MNRLRRWAKRLKQDTYALYVAAKHPRVPRAAKVLASIVLAYALSPVDLIPDFIWGCWTTSFWCRSAWRSSFA